MTKTLKCEAVEFRQIFRPFPQELQNIIIAKEIVAPVNLVYNRKRSRHWTSLNPLNKYFLFCLIQFCPKCFCSGCVHVKRSQVESGGFRHVADELSVMWRPYPLSTCTSTVWGGSARGHEQVSRGVLFTPWSLHNAEHAAEITDTVGDHFGWLSYNPRDWKSQAMTRQNAGCIWQEETDLFYSAS